MISKSISISKKVNQLDDVAALIYTWIQPHTDDFGCMDGDPDSIKAIVVPRRNYTEEQVEKALDQMEGHDLIVRYEIEGENYIQVARFEEHQTFRNDRPRRSQYPQPTDIPMTPKRKTKGDKRQRKLSEVKLSEEKETYGEMENVKLKIEEYQKLTDLMGEKNTHILIFELDTYIASKGAKYRSHYATILNWARRKSVEMKSGGRGKEIISST